MMDFVAMAGSMKEGVVESICNNCNAGNAPLRLRALMVNSKDRPQNRVPAIQLQATKAPPMIKNESGAVVPNPAFNPTDVTPLVTWEVVEEFCDDKACFDALMDKFWRLGQQRLKVLWGR